MGTKKDPGPFDCYTTAEADEPIFTLKASDPVFSKVIEHWLRERQLHFFMEGTPITEKEREKREEARKVIGQGIAWQLARELLEIEQQQLPGITSST